MEAPYRNRSARLIKIFPGNLGAFPARGAGNRAIRLNKILADFPPAKMLYRFYPLRVLVLKRRPASLLPDFT
jgi:hypothetical protein